ncbi:MAG: hypothetical protein K2F69_06550 [Bacteroidaceae bacterium]|nr:hypothetical protein [Bacteroidaceae bacterium]
MDTINRQAHSPEVDKLMKGTMPFVTRYGITLVMLALVIIFLVLSLSDSPAHQLLQDIIEHTKKQIYAKSLAS